MLRRYEGFMNGGKPLYLDLNKAATAERAPDNMTSSEGGYVWQVTFLCEYGACEKYIVTPEESLDKYLDNMENKDVTQS